MGERAGRRQPPPIPERESGTVLGVATRSPDVKTEPNVSQLRKVPARVLDRPGGSVLLGGARDGVRPLSDGAGRRLRYRDACWVRSMSDDLHVAESPRFEFDLRYLLGLTA
jgi:hypothetical protein